MNSERKFRLVSFSVVVVAKNHNPTLLNPDFLRIHEIVQSKREIVEAITTPPVSIVRYRDGLSITVEFEKLQVSESASDRLLDNWETPRVAERFVRTLPHVSYKAVGLNWIGTVSEVDAVKWLKSRFITSGPWNEKGLSLESAGVRFTYSLDAKSRCNLQIEAGEAQDQSEKTESGIAVNANYHRDVKDSVEETCKAIKQWKSYQRHLSRVLKILLDAKV